MAVTSLQLHWHGATGDATAEKVEYSAVYRVTTNSTATGPAAIFAYMRGLDIWLGSSYDYGGDSDSTAYCDRVSQPRHVDGSANIWELTLHYSTKGANKGQGVDIDGNPSDDPLDWRPEVWTSGSLISSPVSEAKYLGGFLHVPAKHVVGDVIMVQNSAGTPVEDPPLEEEIPIQRVYIRTRQATYDVSWAENQLGKINFGAVKVNPALPFVGKWAAKTLMISEVQAQPKRESIERGGVRVVADYVEVTVELQHNPRGWKQVLVDMGPDRLIEAGVPDGKGGTVSPGDILNGCAPAARVLDPINGLPVEGNVLFDGAGQPQQDAPIVPVKITWQTQGERIFDLVPYLKEALQGA